MKNILQIITLILIFFYSLISAQALSSDSLRGNFTYLLKTKANALQQDIHFNEFFLLQISDRYSVFASINSLKRDSIMTVQTSKGLSGGGNTIDFRGLNLPKTTSDYTILNFNNKVSYYERIAMSHLYYAEPEISEWKIIDEEKEINSLFCKKAVTNFKGRDWIAWFAPSIQLPFGPYKFSGLPGLIVKISDSNGDYDFELVKSVSSKDMKGKLTSIDKKRYINSIETTKEKFNAAKLNLKLNGLGVLQSIGVDLTAEQIENLRRREKEYNKKSLFENPIELAP